MHYFREKLEGKTSVAFLYNFTNHHTSDTSAVGGYHAQLPQINKETSLDSLVQACESMPITANRQTDKSRFITSGLLLPKFVLLKREDYGYSCSYHVGLGGTSFR